MTRLLVVVVNHRTAALVEEGLECLESQVARHPGRRVVVVDNDSQDGSFERLTTFVERRGFGTWARVVAAPNDGFAAGNNVAIEPALASATPPDFVLLLNPDALVRPGAIDALLDFAARHPQAGLVGSRLIHRDGRVQASTFRFPSLMTELLDGARLGPLTRAFAKHHILAPLTDTPSRTDWVAGASLLVRREVFEAIGLMDAEYFLYFEETDFCRRATDAGFECWYVPQSQVVHLVGQSTGVTNTEAARRRRPAYWFASRRRYFTKHFGRTHTALIDTVFVLAHLSWRVRGALTRRASDDPAHFLADFVRHAFLGASRAARPSPPSAARESARRAA
jgi:GT2 family glycosyltransferase